VDERDASDTVSPGGWALPPDRPAPAVPYPGVHWSWTAIRTTPSIHETAWVAPTATVYGRVRLGPLVSVWYGCVIRGDHEFIEVGEESNIQDGSILHVDPGEPCILGARVTLGHRAVVHASVVEDEALIGMSATVLSRCRIGRGALIAAGAVVKEGTDVPAGTLWAGCPAKQIQVLTDEQRARLARTYQHYVNNGIAHRAWLSPGTPTTMAIAPSAGSPVLPPDSVPAEVTGPPAQVPWQH
jgi:gamma-carbonic anhydrase